MPWHILSWPEGDLRTITPTGNTPLLRRPFVHGAWDCWQVCADWYKREWGLEFEAFKREDGWWESAGNTSLYEANYEAAGFVRVDQPQRGDLIVMAIGEQLTRIMRGFISVMIRSCLEKTQMCSGRGRFCCITCMIGCLK